MSQDPTATVRDRFNQAASRLTASLGSPFALVTAVLVIVVWALTGPIFSFSETWQLIINTGTTIVTFLMVFVIQASQNRDSKALHLKLDEVIRAIEGARNEFISTEESTEAQILERETELLEIAHDGDSEPLETARPAASRAPR
jgi:low affinity Fe/Cu permease